jgi:hypothetical protein
MKRSGLADSPFFTAAPHTPEQPIYMANERKSERTDLRSEIRTENRSEALPQKRRTKRYSFEFYDDQILKLKQLKYKTEMTGQNVTLSDIVRYALDQYLNDQEA